MLSVRSLVSASLAFAASIAAAAPVQWTVASGGNGHYYDLNTTGGLTYPLAKAAATTQTYLGLTGHLATWTATAEFDFLYDNVVGPGNVNHDVWYWYGEEQSVTDPNNRTANWTTATGEVVPPSTAAAWNIDYFEGTNHTFALTSYYSTRQPFDYAKDFTANMGGYVVEYEPVPEPSAFAALGLGALALLRRRRK